jgi:hypothetical protein
MSYAPIFTKIVIVKNKKVGLRPLGFFETFANAFGISFPEEVE